MFTHLMLAVKDFTYFKTWYNAKQGTLFSWIISWISIEIAVGKCKLHYNLQAKFHFAFMDSLEPLLCIRKGKTFTNFIKLEQY